MTFSEGAPRTAESQRNLTYHLVALSHLGGNNARDARLQAQASQTNIELVSGDLCIRYLLIFARLAWHRCDISILFAVFHTALAIQDC